MSDITYRRWFTYSAITLVTPMPLPCRLGAFSARSTKHRLGTSLHSDSIQCFTATVTLPKQRALVVIGSDSAMARL